VGEDKTYEIHRDSRGRKDRALELGRGRAGGGDRNDYEREKADLRSARELESLSEKGLTRSRKGIDAALGWSKITNWAGAVKRKEKSRAKFEQHERLNNQSMVQEAHT